MLCVGYKREKPVDKKREEESLVGKTIKKKRKECEGSTLKSSGTINLGIYHIGSRWCKEMRNDWRPNTIDVTTRKRMKTQSEILYIYIKKAKRKKKNQMDYYYYYCEGQNLCCSFSELYPRGEKKQKQETGRQQQQSATSQ